MPLQNRVLPTGEIVAQPWRGQMMGNRGRLHDDEMRLGTRRWRHQNWVCCVTEFRGRKRLPMPRAGAPTVYTALFFWDEASAFAVGHRPCGECRYSDHRRFMQLWRDAGLPGRTAKEVDRVLHQSRVGRDRSQIRHKARIEDLPVGAYMLLAEGPAYISDRGLMLWTPQAGLELPPRTGEVDVLTPAPILTVFAAGYRPDLREDMPSP